MNDKNKNERENRSFRIEKGIWRTFSIIVKLNPAVEFMSDVLESLVKQYIDENNHLLTNSNIELIDEVDEILGDD